jgi:uncharacterized membrane protein
MVNRAIPQSLFQPVGPLKREAGMKRARRWAINRSMKKQPSTEHHTHNGKGDQLLANGLGLFSVGMGLAQVLIPSRIAKWAGIQRPLPLIPAMGARELGSGAGLLSQRAVDRWAWFRLGGDVINLAMLGMAAKSKGASRNRLAIAAAAVAGVAALDLYCSRRLSKRAANRTIHVDSSITVDRSPEDLFRAWGNFEHLPRFVNQLLKVDKAGDDIWHCSSIGPAGTPVEWDAQVTQDQSNRSIAWRSLEGAPVDHSGSVQFEPAPEGHGTRVHVVLDYEPHRGRFVPTLPAFFTRHRENKTPSPEIAMHN